MKYTYTHGGTQGSTGYFYPRLENNYTLYELFDLWTQRQWDAYLKKYIHVCLEELMWDELQNLLEEMWAKKWDCAVYELLYEYVWLKGQWTPLGKFLDKLRKNCKCLPIRTSLTARIGFDCKTRIYIAKVSNDNIWRHENLPSACEYKNMLSGMAELADALIKIEKNFIPDHGNENIFKQSSSNADILKNINSAIKRLESANILAGEEMRHECSLAPIGLLRKWNLQAKTAMEEKTSELLGTATAYGRGLTIPEARISLAMEIVERSSAYVSIENKSGQWNIQNRKNMPVLLHLSPNEMKNEGLGTAWPNIPWDVHCWTDKKILWMKCEDNKNTNLFVPIQAIYLFDNLDEPRIFESLGSTGLGAGPTSFYAKLSAILEVIERDAQATMPYNEADCFCLRSNDKRIQGLLDDYLAQGIYVQFQDITTEFGIPAYRCFLVDREHRISMGSASSVNGKTAMLRALTETPWEYSYGRLSGKPSLCPKRQLPVKYLEDMPVFGTGDAKSDLEFVEKILSAHGYQCIYADITRKDLDLPVFRAIVPGLEYNTIFDWENLPSPRLLARQMILLDNK